jgi:hypothetical protein
VCLTIGPRLTNNFWGIPILEICNVYGQEVREIQKVAKSKTKSMIYLAFGIDSENERTPYLRKRHDNTIQSHN